MMQWLAHCSDVLRFEETLGGAATRHANIMEDGNRNAA
jgi:hypothetical protein